MCEEKVKGFFNSLNGSYSHSEKGWYFPLGLLEEILLKTKGFFGDFAIKEIPSFVLEALKPIGGILDVSKDFALVYEENDDKVNEKNPYI